MALAFKNNASVIFDINNEYITMPRDTVSQTNQAGNGWTGTSTRATTNDNLKSLRDPLNKLVYEMHQYHDDGPGSTDACQSSTVGIERVKGATAWLRANGKKGIIGETASGDNPTCLGAVIGLLDHLKAKSDVWKGVIWWSAGPGWASDYNANFEPPSGLSHSYYNALLKSYLRGAQSRPASSAVAAQGCTTTASNSHAASASFRYLGRVNPAHSWR
ncbi:Endoglucanase gh5-1-like protein [Elsinoe fawcettii]|nr:Endoglucanase gh5-1-like protein [Elsinoe fawcettii]